MDKLRNDNDNADYAEEAGRLRWERRIERQLAARDPFYPSELHWQDVLSRNGIEEEEGGAECR